MCPVAPNYATRRLFDSFALSPQFISFRPSSSAALANNVGFSPCELCVTLKGFLNSDRPLHVHEIFGRIFLLNIYFELYFD